ncbi:hypothetical protein DFQ03_2967 [Maribacter caenipelagi]|uniref:Uncharacterized protein n=1 Tax=Maribacter caenipelagi TaxID=1447781 RepID=A0A4R7D0C8_9FLAO|nr:hypothetical protein [Maribacter caenipelagi]TDS13672.1 hypothetical protein DFQ03_2967 [Maribacter caenipelagi]
MKLKRSLFCLVIIICISSCRTLSIPNDKTLDNIVLVTGDTLYGKVDYFKEQYVFSEFYKKIRLTDTNGRKRRFKRKKVLSYRVDGYDYESFKLDQETKLFRNGRYLDTKYYINPNSVQYFLKVITKGKLSLYELEWIDHDNNDLRSVDLIKKAEDRFFTPANSMLGHVAKKTVSRYLSDCPEIEKKIMEKDFKYVFQVVDFYNKNCQ